jgi:hypothetical protein
VYAEGIGAFEVYRMFSMRNFHGRAWEGFNAAYPVGNAWKEDL